MSAADIHGQAPVQIHFILLKLDNGHASKIDSELRVKETAVRVGQRMTHDTNVSSYSQSGLLHRSTNDNHIPSDGLLT